MLVAGRYDGILLASFGGPRTPDDVIPFLQNVTRGRGIPVERLQSVAEHYYHFGGVSPINEQTDALAVALRTELAARGHELPVWIGNRNWSPYLPDVLQQAYRAGHRRLLAVLTSAYTSYSSCRQYLGDFDTALEQTGLAGRLQIGKIRQFFNHPGFMTPFAQGLIDALDGLAAADPALTSDDVEIIFTGHSLPIQAARTSGSGAWRQADGGAYAAQHRQTADQIVRTVNAARDQLPGLGVAHWQLAWQSRSGPAAQPWLEPDVNDAIEALVGSGRKAVVSVPVSFISDHMEVVWDLDIEAADTAAKHGFAYARVRTPGTHPAFVGALAEMVEECQGIRSQCTHFGEHGPWPADCPQDCCPVPARPKHGAVAHR